MVVNPKDIAGIPVNQVSPRALLKEVSDPVYGSERVSVFQSVLICADLADIRSKGWEVQCPNCGILKTTRKIMAHQRSAECNRAKEEAETAQKGPVLGYADPSGWTWFIKAMVHKTYLSRYLS